MNLKELNYVRSAGLGVFMAFVEEICSNNGDIKFGELSPNIFTIFDLLGLPHIFDFVETNDKNNNIRRNEI